ncbi:MAG: glucosidase [Candidatus Korobacteraceae bacterium]
MTIEHDRLEESRRKVKPWKKWGPYLSERQWGTVREDYSKDGNAWAYFTHDQARSRAYRWGEDGLAGICNENQTLCFAIALWNEKDPIVKERLFGLTNSEGNHGEDVKEYYFYIDSTPTHSYMKYLYKYPQAAYPYQQLIRNSRERSRSEFEYELIDTGVFDQDRYFDVFVEYAKAGPEDMLIKITACNRGPETAPLHVLPTLWFRNTWSWDGAGQKPVLEKIPGVETATVLARHEDPLFKESLGHYYLHCDGNIPLHFTENETNNRRLFGTANASPYVKDGINDHVVAGIAETVNPNNTGTKVSPHVRLKLEPGQSQVIRLRLRKALPTASEDAFEDFDKHFQQRVAEADEFYESIIPPVLRQNPDRASIFRQALSGMLWSKQYFYYDVDKWLEDHGVDQFTPDQQAFRNEHWYHMYNADIISMPDKWEYPWYAAWDLAFHVISLTLVDEDFGREQLDLMLQGQYLHPNGQLPAYEWNFGDVNPPVHAWATAFASRLHQLNHGRDKEHVEWLEACFHKLLLNFTWWVNRKDRYGKNVFEGGFLGLDNIGVFDRSAPLPTGGYLEQADGTAWMALFCQNMLEIAVNLTLDRPSYIGMCRKFLDHFLWIVSSMCNTGATGMWDEEDGFFYDVLQMPNGYSQRLKVRSIVGLLPLCAVTVFEGEGLKISYDLQDHVAHFLKARPERRTLIHDPLQQGYGGRRLLAILDEGKLRRVLRTMLDDNEFLSPFGIRSLSRYHADHPYIFRADDKEFRVSYLPAESDTGMFGGNSNWRGPIWMPVNVLIIRALLQYYSFYGNDFTVECPTGSGHFMNLYQIAEELGRRLESIFSKDTAGKRAVYGGTKTFQEDPHWRDYILFYEYFHGDNGAGLGASHQTGWTGTIAAVMRLFATVSAERMLEFGKAALANEPRKIVDSRFASR